MRIQKESSLIELFDSVLRSLGVAYVLGGLKPCCRGSISVENVSLLEKFCQKNSLYLELSDHCFVPNFDRGKGDYSNSLKIVNIKSKGSRRFAYISKAKKIVQYVKFLESTQKDESTIGKLFGYPDCCIEFYSKYKEIAAKRQFDFILLCQERVKLREFKPHPFYNNYALRYFNIALLDYFPCSLDCKNSMYLSRKRLAFLKDDFPKTANLFERELSSFVLYTEEYGIFYSHNYRQSGDVINFDRLQATVHNKLYYKLQKLKKIRIISHDKIIIGDLTLAGEDIGVFIYN